MNIELRPERIVAAPLRVRARPHTESVAVEPRLIVVANRLPVTAVVKGGKLTLQQSVGGLVSGLGAYLDARKRAQRPFAWVGWPGMDPPEHMKPQLVAQLREHHAYPVLVDEALMDGFYGGLCNRTLWPLFHYFTTYAAFEDADWERYREVNELFADAVLGVVRPGDVVWIHDYHLMLLPAMLRERAPDIGIGFFLHIPFPSFEVFRMLPPRWREEILRGILGADIVGFHTHDYTQYFLRCVMRILGYEHTLGRIVAGDRLVATDTFPMGIDYARYHDAALTPAVASERESLQASLGTHKVVVSVDRLDYTKGILNRLQGYERFLEANPAWNRRVVLMLVLVPSRTGVDRYREMKRRIDEKVGEINGRFGTPGWTPILYQYRSLSFTELVALYARGDVALVTPLRDGMNLVAKEYIAARGDTGGVLVLSEMAGASRELGEAIVINPAVRDEIAGALLQALEMPLEEQVRRNRITQERLRRYDVTRWADEFLDKLGSARTEQARFCARLLGPRGEERIVSEYHSAEHRLLLLDYDGTLVPLARRPEAAIPGEELRRVLARLAADRATDVVIISGRPRDELERWFGDSGLHLVAEHGAWTRTWGSGWRMAKPLRSDWKPGIEPILRLAADRLPGAFVEEKEFALVWHYRRADRELAALRERELVDGLTALTANLDLSVLQGNCVIEVRNAGVTKGTAALDLLAGSDADFILAVGDDATDEDMFGVLPESAATIRVGMGGTRARFSLPDTADVLNLLRRLAGDEAGTAA